MLNDIEIVIAVPVFVLLAILVYQPIKKAFNFDTQMSVILSMCVSALCVTGMTRSAKGVPGTVLLPYAALGITLLLLFLISFVIGLFKRCKTKRKRAGNNEYARYDKHQKLKSMKNRYR